VPHKFEEDPFPIRVLQVQGDAPLAPVQVDVVEALTLLERRELPGIVTFSWYLQLMTSAPISARSIVQ